jgi:hypothetical protein
MLNLSAADVAALKNELQGLTSEPLPDNTKALLLGLEITDMFSARCSAPAREASASQSCARLTRPSPQTQRP